MSRLLAADAVSVGHHVLVDILVADFGLLIADADLVKSLIQAEIGHNRRDDRVVEELSSLLHVTAVDIQNVVAGDDIALLIDTQTPVGVAVVSKSDVQVVVHDKLLQMLDVRGAAVRVDIESVGVVVHHISLCAKCVKNSLRDRPGRSVGDIQADTLSVVAVF